MRRLTCSGTTGLLVLLCAAAFATSFASAAVPRGARVLGPLAADTPLHLTVALNPRDPTALASYAQTVSDPSSTNYRHYLTVAEFAARFGPTAATIQQVTAALRARGLSPGAVSANGLSLPVNATASLVSSALSVTFARVQYQGQSAYVNTTAPSLGADFSGTVQSIIGLDNLSTERPLGLARRRLARSRSARTGAAARQRPAVAPEFSPQLVAHATGPAPCSTAATASSVQRGAYTADKLASAYSLGGIYQGGNLGAGVTVAIFELEPNFPSDVTAFQACYGITPTATQSNVSYVPVDGFTGTASLPNGDGTETELDIDNVIAVAPAANILVYQASGNGNTPYDTYNAIISQNRAKVISTSWGDCEPDLGVSMAQAENTLFQEAATQGQSIFAASGDDGTEDCFADPGFSQPNLASVDDPSSQPFVTGVGGSSLQLSPSRTETVWNSASGATGGGNSVFWPMPSYQSGAAAQLGVINSASSSSICGQASGFCRQVPDVSADADPNPGYLIYYGGNGNPTDLTAWQSAGGTSASAPLWAGVVALADASSGCASAPIGFANPALYGAAGSTQYSSLFSDVLTGNNAWQPSPPAPAGFAAKAGYDQVTGVGTPISSALVTALCANHVNVTTPTAQSTVAGAAAALQIQAVASFGPISYAATGLPPGLTISPTTGLISGAPTTPGSYSVTVTASVQGQSGTTSFAWAITPATVSISPVAPQTGQAGKAASLQIAAADNNGTPVGYAATGLPPGLTLNAASGVITGVPSLPGQSSVTITASATGAPPAQTTFVWTITSRATATAHAATLRGLRGKPALSVVVAAAPGGAPIRQIVITLPAGVTLKTASRGLLRSVSLSGHIASVTASATRHQLRVTLNMGGTAGTTITVRAPALIASAALRRKVGKHHAPVLHFTVQLIDTAGNKTTLPETIKPS